MGEETKKPAIQWHPAFYAGIQIEFSQEKEKLEFENEHQLGTKPKQIDVLIIKKESEDVIQKNIGRIFRKHNIIEYKSPDDYLSIDDFYQVYGYACFYKEELLTAELLEEENFWLRYLTNDMKTVEEANKILSEYEGNQKEKNHKSVMNVIVNANKEVFKEAKKMCEALLELMKDELEASKKAGEEAGRIAGEKAGEKAGIIRLIQTKLSKGKTVEAIADDLEDSVENILTLIKEMDKEKEESK